jgi:hypothetical protein
LTCNAALALGVAPGRPPEASAVEVAAGNARPAHRACVLSPAGVVDAHFRRLAPAGPAT